MTIAPCPEIATYQLRSEGRAPMWIAKYVYRGDLLSATFEGSTELEACDAACDFWRREQLSVAKARVARGEHAA